MWLLSSISSPGSAANVIRPFAIIFDETAFLKFIWLAAAAVLIFRATSVRLRKDALPEIILVLASITTIVVTSQLKHVQLNEFDIGYFVIPMG
jgi:hypothetical protein